MRRIVAYIYNYKSEAGCLCRQKNTGFCRVEMNNDKCGVTLCLKDGCGVEGMAHIFTVNKVKEAVADRNIYRRKKLGQAYSMCGGVLNAKLCLTEADGICVECGGRVYVALWKECLQNIEFVEEQNIKEEKNVKEEQNVRAERNVKEEQNIRAEKNVKVGQNIREEKNVKEEQNVRAETNIKEKQRTSSELTRIYNRLCKVRVVLNGTEYPAVRLSPQEMIMLPRSCWRLANNMFLMESYYRYRHILFMRYGGKYVIAVPWAKENQCEAKRFGFEECASGFLFGRNRDEKNYWIMNLEDKL